MVFFKKHGAKRQDIRKSLKLSDVDWRTMKVRCNKLQVPMVQLQHDMIMVYSDFIYGLITLSLVKYNAT